MKPLESHPMFNPAIKVVDAPPKENKTLPAAMEEGLNLFDQVPVPPPAVKGTLITFGQTRSKMFNHFSKPLPPHNYHTILCSVQEERAKGHPGL